MFSRTFIFAELIICIVSSLSILLLLFYLDPERNLVLAAGLMGTAILLASSTLLGIVLYAVKKIFARGDVSISTAVSSLRQGSLMTIGGITTGIFHYFGVLQIQTFALMIATLILIEGICASLIAED